MDRIQEDITGLDFQSFKWACKTVDAVIRNFEIIGEANKNLSVTIKYKYSGVVPWVPEAKLQTSNLKPQTPTPNVHVSHMSAGYL